MKKTGKKMASKADLMKMKKDDIKQDKKMVEKAAKKIKMKVKDKMKADY
jgi:hypothetical protein